MMSTYSPVNDKFSYGHKVIKTLIKIVHDVDNVAITIYSLNIDLPKLTFTAQTLIVVHVSGITVGKMLVEKCTNSQCKLGNKKSASYTYICNLQHLSLQLNVTSSNRMNNLSFQ